MLISLAVIHTAITLVAGHILGYSLGVANQDATFDYVICGGGTAGLTIAARLAEGRSERVAVIEAGSFYEVDSGNETQIPGKASVGVNTDPSDIPSKIDWGFVTIPQPALGGRELYYTRGKILGGSSAVNCLGYHRDVTSHSYPSLRS